MKCNVGCADRPFRWVLVAVLLGVAAFADVPAAWRVTEAVIGVIVVVTTWKRFCSANLILGIVIYHARVRGAESAKT